MPTPVAHALAGWCVAAAPGVGLERSRGALAALLVAANLPDIDYLALVGGRAAMEAHHQGFTHSLGFVLAAALPLALPLRRFVGPARAWVLAALAGASHLLFDLVSFDEKPPIGFPLFWPLSDGRYHAPWTLFPGIERSSLDRIIGMRNLRELAVELAVLAPLVYLAWRRRHGAPGAAP